MMNNFQNSLEQYPDILTADHLIKLGLFVNRVAVYRSRLKHKEAHPPHFLVGQRARYVKSELINWLNKKA
jgi:hypothetical protein